MVDIVPKWNQLLAQLAEQLGASGETTVTPYLLEELTRPMLAKLTGRAQMLFLSGPDAVGKSTIQRALNAAGVLRCPSVYTRSLRSDEQPGVDVISVSPAEFQERRARGDFLYDQPRHGAEHGVSRSVVAELLMTGRPVVMERSPRSLPLVVKSDLLQEVPWVAVYILPPDPQLLLERLERRADKGDGDVDPNQRLQKTLEEFPVTGGLYHGFLVNDNFERLVPLLRSLFREAP